MKTKICFWFVLLAVGLIFNACERKADIEPVADAIEETTILPDHARLDKPGGAPCFTDFEPELCDCKYKIDYVSNPNHKWRLYSSNGKNARCCSNGNYFNNVDISDPCGTSNVETGVWRNFRCDLKAGITYLRFESSICGSGECNYVPNTMQLTVSCTTLDSNPYAPNTGEMTYWLYANNDGNSCVNDFGTAAVQANADCEL